LLISNVCDLRKTTSNVDESNNRLKALSKSIFELSEFIPEFVAKAVQNQITSFHLSLLERLSTKGIATLSTAITYSITLLCTT